MSRLIMGVRKTIKKNTVSNLEEPDQEKIENFSANILKGPAHAFRKYD